MNKRVFYFNINYGCNNHCTFCYSHNTKFDLKAHKEIPLNIFEEYLIHNAVSSGDRVILNGGEPLLYSNINEMLDILKATGCETVIFTNGRLLSTINKYNINSKFRFVVPIHGFESLHDKITRTKGSYAETVRSMKELTDSSNGCLIDLKIILNRGIMESDKSFAKTLEAFDKISFNNAVHITKMADTNISKKNGCISLSNNMVSRHTLMLLDHYYKTKYAVKIFDTCIKAIEWLQLCSVEKFRYSIEVIGKDFAKEEEIKLFRDPHDCCKGCANMEFCLSSVTEFKVLEFFNGKIYENLE